MPRTSDGFVYRKNGLYLYCAISTTHTGEHVYVEWREDIDRATVFYTLPPWKVRGDIAGAERVPVREERRVFLVDD